MKTFILKCYSSVKFNTFDYLQHIVFHTKVDKSDQTMSYVFNVETVKTYDINRRYMVSYWMATGF